MVCTQRKNNDMKMDASVFPDLDALSRAALGELLDILRDAVRDRGRFAIALAGGNTPARLYRLWAEPQTADGIPWDRVHFFYGDERYVPPDDPLSNYRMTRETLISQVPIPAANVHPVPTTLRPAEKAAEAYEAELRKFFADSSTSGTPIFDLQLLGLGTEGHTLSLFPGSPVLEETQRWVAAVEVAAEPPQRITLTPVVANQARHTFFLVAGKDKREIVEALKSEPEGQPSQYPAARIQPAGGVLWFFDQAAAG
jgi:6-phosphogluconolactonase